jgi:CheY-like chemotaxis protein
MLIVDDELPIQGLLNRLFRVRGWRVDVASNGAEALLRINESVTEASPYSVIICDLRMPVLSGTELHDLLQGEQPDVLERLMFLSGDIVGDDVRTFVDRTMCRILSKPLDIADLDRAVASMARTAGATVTQATNGAWHVSA